MESIPNIDFGKASQLVSQKICAQENWRILFFQDPTESIEVHCDSKWLPSDFPKALDIIQNGLEGLQKLALAVYPDLKVVNFKALCYMGISVHTWIWYWPLAPSSSVLMSKRLSSSLLLICHSMLRSRSGGERVPEVPSQSPPTIRALYRSLLKKNYARIRWFDQKREAIKRTRLGLTLYWQQPVSISLRLVDISKEGEKAKELWQVGDKDSVDVVTLDLLRQSIHLHLVIHFVMKF